MLTTVGIFLLTLSTWQYGVTEPDCCYVDPGNTSTSPPGSWGGGEGRNVNWSGNCSELHKILPLEGVNLHMSTELLVVLALLGLVVSEYMVALYRNCLKVANGE